MKYLNPQADLTFKKVFGEHSDLLISFLNALLPFEHPEEEITWLEYLSPELVPFNPLRKDSIVDVRCRDRIGRQFIVEMQMIWTSAYKQRVLFNGAKAYVSQLEKGFTYDLLQPVYSLNLLNDVFSDADDYYHDFRIVETGNPREVIEGMRFVFIELPKFTPKKYSDKKMQVLWLRYLTEINEKTREVPDDLKENPLINKAMSQLEESAFSEAQLLGYDKFWDIISNERTTVNVAAKDGMKKGYAKGYEAGQSAGHAKGLAEGHAKGLAEGHAEGRAEALLQTARKMKSAGISPEDIARLVGLPLDTIRKL